MFNGLKEGGQKVINYETKPNVLVSDAAGSIHNGFRAVFGDNVIIVMCWFHAKKVNQEEILRDIGYLRLASTPEMFRNGAKLLISKWNDIESEFCAYFNDEWLTRITFLVFRVLKLLIGGEFNFKSDRMDPDYS